MELPKRGEKVKQTIEKMRELEDDLALAGEPEKAGILANLRRDLQIDNE